MSSRRSHNVFKNSLAETNTTPAKKKKKKRKRKAPTEPLDETDLFRGSLVETPVDEEPIKNPKTEQSDPVGIDPPKSRRRSPRRSAVSRKGKAPASTRHQIGSVSPQFVAGSVPGSRLFSRPSKKTRASSASSSRQSAPHIPASAQTEEKREKTRTVSVTFKEVEEGEESEHASSSSGTPEYVLDNDLLQLYKRPNSNDDNDGDEDNSESVSRGYVNESADSQERSLFPTDPASHTARLPSLRLLSSVNKVAPLPVSETTTPDVVSTNGTWTPPSLLFSPVSPKLSQPSPEMSRPLLPGKSEQPLPTTSSRSGPPKEYLQSPQAQGPYSEGLGAADVRSLTPSCHDSDLSYHSSKEFTKARHRMRELMSANSSRDESMQLTSFLDDMPIGGNPDMELLEGVGGDGAAGGDGLGLKKSDSSEVLNLTLHQCARDGDEYNMKILLRHLGSTVKKRINQYDEDDLTPLHYAARYNFLGVVKLLVENGANVNKRGEDDVTPLHHAARYRREKNKKKDAAADANPDEPLVPNLKMLVMKPEVGSDKETEQGDEPCKGIEEKEEECDKQDTEETPLRKQSKREGSRRLTKPGLNGIPLLEQYETEFGQGQESVINYLVSNGAMVNCQDIYGQTPLHFSAMRGNEVACRDLLAIPGVNIEAQDKQGISPLHMAAIHNQVEIAFMLIESGAKLRCEDSENSTPLHYACTEGNVELVQALFEAGAKSPEGWVMVTDMVSDQDVEGSTCLHLAVDNGHYEVAKICLDKRAEVNRPRKHYMYPLHLAAQTGDIRIARLLVENSARIDVVNDEQATALHRAASFNHTEVAKFLVDRGARINRRDKDNYTPLLLAATYGHVETVELLLQKGADYTAVDKYDRTAIYLACEENKQTVLEKLLSYTHVKRLINTSDQYDASPLHISAQNGYLDIVKMLLSHGADIDSKNEEEQTPVHLAAKFGRTNVVREIVRMDKSVLNDEDENSNTALHLAAQYGHNKVADVLLELGADVSARNYNQWTPLDLAASKGWTKTCSVLLNNDAPVDPTDKNKVTPLHLAARYGHPRVIELLIDWDADVSLEDTEGNNCLDLAIENNHSNVAMRIINSDVWQQALRNSTEDSTTGRIDTPIRKLIKKMPEVAERCFDRCLCYGQEKNPERPDYEITFNYEFLDDTYMPWIHESYRKRMKADDATSISDSSSVGSVFDDDDRLLPSAKPYTSDSNFLKKNHPLFIMVSSEREILLDHPLVTSLLRHKWNTFGRFFYYLSLFIYCIFLTFLTGYIVLTDPPQRFNSSDVKKIEDNDCGNLYENHTQSLFSKIGTYVIIALAAFNLLKELLQIYQAKLAYLGWTNLIEWVTYVTALLLVISFNECQRETGYRHEWQWSLGAISVFLAWINLVLFIQKFPQLGIYVVMFTDVLYTFAQFFIVFFLFIVAFALAFYTVLQQQVPFEDVPRALIKTSVMMIGEFEFDSIFNDATNPVLYPVVSYILFVLFLIIMSIILMNLLVGLAVDDIKAVQEQAALKRMAMQVELALDVERVIPDFIRRKAFVKRKTIKPNMYMFSNPISRFFFSQTGLTTKSLQEHLNPELDEIEKVQENQEKLSTDVKKLKRNMKDLQETSQRIESMMRAVIRAQHIDWQDEDYQEEDEVDQIHAGLSY